MANGNGQRGVVITWAIFVVLAGATGTLFSLAWKAGGAIEKVDGKAETNATAIVNARDFIETVKREGTDICRSAQLTGVEVKVKIGNMDRRLTDMEGKLDKNAEMQQVILEEIRKIK